MSQPFVHHTLDQVRQSGLLSPERIAEVAAEIERRIEPVFDCKGRQIETAVMADLGEHGRYLYMRNDSDSQKDYLNRTVLAVVLTEAERKLVNDHCSALRSLARDTSLFSKAEKVPGAEWGEGVFWGDHYSASVEEFLDHWVCYVEEGDELPVFVWAAQARTVIPKLRVADVVEHYVCDQGWEDMDTDDLNGVADLQAALDRFTEVNSPVVSFAPDERKAILVEDLCRAALEEARR